MRTLFALMVVVAVACGSSSKPTTGPGAGPASDVASDTCCCKSNPLTSEDGKPAYDIGNRMECSQKQGECVPDVQCAKTPQPE